MKFRSLSTKITLWTIVAMLITPVSVGVVYMVKQYELGERFSQTVDRSDAILKATLIRDLEHAMMVNQLDGARKVIKEVSEFEGVVGVQLMDQHGRTVSSYGEAEDVKLTKPQKDQLLKEGKELNLFTKVDDRSVKLTALPIKNKDECRFCHRLTEVNGALIIRQRSLNIASETNFLVAIMLISLLLASIVASLTLLTMLAREVVGPIRGLSRATKKVGKSQLDVTVPVTGDDEIGELAQSFNRMTRDLKKSCDEVEKRNLVCQEAYNSLQTTQKKLIQSEKLASIGTLVAGIAHEINNPVGIIAARADCMIMEAKEKRLDEQCMEDLMVINKHAGRIANITQSLLTFARQAHAEMAPVDMNAVVEDTIFLTAKQFAGEGIKVQSILSPASPMVMGNSNMIQQVLLDLLNNARDAMGPSGTVTVATANSGDKVEITVTDTGEGISEDTLDKIFDPFFTTKEVGKGTGLGLSVSYGIIQDLGGNIEVRSKKGNGTAFIITLPRLKES